MTVCPKCSTTITHVNGTAIEAHLPSQILKSVSFSCPACGVVLGVTVDPIAIKTDTVDEVVAAIRKLVAAFRRG